MARLKDKHKTFIVKQLACYTSVGEVQEALKTEFSVEASKDQVSRYNPTTINGQKLAKDLKLLFKTARMEYLEDIQKHEIAKKGWRLGELQKMVEKLIDKGNYALAAQLIEQGAKEVGGIFEGKNNDNTGGDGTTINAYIQQIYARLEGKDY